MWIDFGGKVAVSIPSTIVSFCVYFFLHTFQQVDMRSLWLKGRSFESFCEDFFFVCIFISTFHCKFDTTYLSCGGVRIVGTLTALGIFLLL